MPVIQKGTELMDKYICLKDCNEHLVFIKPEDIITALKENDFKIYDIGIAEIWEFYVQYIGRNGTLPITKENIQKVFSSDK